MEDKVSTILAFTVARLDDLDEKREQVKALSFFDCLRDSCIPQNDKSLLCNWCTLKVTNKSLIHNEVSKLQDYFYRLKAILTSILTNDIETDSIFVSIKRDLMFQYNTSSLCLENSCSKFVCSMHLEFMAIYNQLRHLLSDAENESLHVIVKELVCDRTKDKKTIDNLNMSVTALQRENLDLRNTINVLQIQNSELSDTVARIQVRNTELADNIIRLEIENVELASRIELIDIRLGTIV